MTQLEQAPRRPVVVTPYIVAVAAAAIIIATVLLGMLLPGRALVPATPDSDTVQEVSPLLLEAEREWQRQREAQGGFTNPLVEMEQAWEEQRRQQSPFDDE